MMRTNSWIPAVFNDLFDTEFMPKCNATAPAINVKESDKAYTVELAAPGMKKEDFNVHINDEGNLVVKLESKQEHKEEDKNTRYLRREFNYSKYEQTLILRRKLRSLARLISHKRWQNTRIISPACPRMQGFFVAFFIDNTPDIITDACLLGL